MANRFDFITKPVKEFFAETPAARFGAELGKRIEEKKPILPAFKQLLPTEKEKKEIISPETALTFLPIGEAAKIAEKIPINQPLAKLTNLIKEAKPARKTIEKLYTAEREKRAGAVASIFKRVEGEKGFIQALGKLKGELVPEGKPKFEAIRTQFEQNDVDELFKQIQRFPELNIYEKVVASNGLQKLFQGEIPQKSQLSLMEDIFGSDLIKTVMKKRPILSKLGDVLTEIVNVPRSLITSFDMSAVLRQAVIPTFTRPVSALKAGKEMFRQTFSPKNFEQWFVNLKQNPSYRLMKESGLYISEPLKTATGLAGKEERFMTNFAQKIPVIGSIIQASERAYVSYLNKMRVDIFENITKKFIKDGVDPKVEPETFKSLADFINNITGRGDIKHAAQYWNTLFFSPRLIKARFSMLNPLWYTKQAAPVRKEAIKSMAEFVGTGTGILVLAKAGGANVEIDPRSTDFGKIRIGNTRWDIWGGFQQWIRVISQLASGQRKTAKGTIIDLTKKKFPFETRLDVAEKFFRGKLAPIPSLGLELFEGQKMFGEEISLSQETIENTIPLYLQDIKEAMEEMGPEALFTVGAPGFFGVGIQTYKEKISQNRFNF